MTGTLAASGAGRARPAGNANETDMLVPEVAFSLTARNTQDRPESGAATLVAAPGDGPVGTVSSKWAKGTGGPAGDEAQNLIAFDWQSGGDVRLNACNEGSPSLQACQVPAVAIPLQYPHQMRREERLNGMGIGNEEDPSYTLECRREHGDAVFPAVTHALTGEGFDASEDGTGRGTPLVASPGEAQVIQEAQTGVRLYESVGANRADAPGSQPTGSLLAFGLSNDPTPTLGQDVMPTLQSKEGASGQGGGRMEAVSFGASVRRLSPTECERLQGFSWLENGVWQDGHTCLCGRNAGRSFPEADACRCPDGPRYRALGNGVAIPPVEWLFRQILATESLEDTP